MDLYSITDPEYLVLNTATIDFVGVEVTRFFRTHYGTTDTNVLAQTHNVGYQSYGLTGEEATAGLAYVLNVDFAMNDLSQRRIQCHVKVPDMVWCTWDGSLLFDSLDALLTYLKMAE